MLQYATLVILAVGAVGLLAIAGAVGQLVDLYRRPPLQPGDVLFVRAFGVQQRCYVVEVGTDGTVLVAPMNASATTPLLEGAVCPREEGLTPYDVPATNARSSAHAPSGRDVDAISASTLGRSSDG